MSCRLFIAWFDLWIGAYWERRTRTLFILPLPMIGVAISFRGKTWLGK